MLPIILLGLGRLHQESGFYLFAQVTIPWLTFLLAFLAGAQFQVASQVEFTQAGATAARLYLADYLGASVGALLAATCLIPWLGVTMTCLGTSAVCGLSALGCYGSRRRRP